MGESLFTKDFLEREYLELGKSYRLIASEQDVDKSTIMYWAKKHNIKSRTSGRKKINLTGCRIGNLLVVKEVKKKLDKHIYWKCQCDCGNISTISTGSLTKGQKRCWDCRNKLISELKWKGYGEISGDKWDKIKKTAGLKNRKFEITIEQAWDLFLKQDRKCALSGVKLVFTRKKKDRSKTTASLDRIDSSKGYIKGNIQWVHKDINKMKQDLDMRSFKEWCGKVYKNAT
tara:strand:- start:444 stop:1133 length:690 start_codon:yes stop_codon:yes gene_type:complete